MEESVFVGTRAKAKSGEGPNPGKNKGKQNETSDGDDNDDDDDDVDEKEKLSSTPSCQCRSRPHADRVGRPGSPLLRSDDFLIRRYNEEKIPYFQVLIFSKDLSDHLLENSISGRVESIFSDRQSSQAVAKSVSETYSRIGSTLLAKTEPMPRGGTLAHLPSARSTGRSVCLSACFPTCPPDRREPTVDEATIPLAGDGGRPLDRRGGRKSGECVSPNRNCRS